MIAELRQPGGARRLGRSLMDGGSRLARDRGLRRDRRPRRAAI